MTSTSNFGVSTRESHDASAFYERFHAPELSTDATVLDDVVIADPFVTGDARHMDAVPDGSVALVVTSPPYFAGKQYEEELERDGIPSTYLEYLDLLRDVFAECVRKLEPGGRIAVNVANLGRKPYRSLSADVIGIFDELGLLLRGEIIWQKAEGATGSCAWGSFRSAANPVLRDITERVVVASKGRFDRARSVKQRAAEGLPHENTLMTDDFMASTLDVWSIPPESARRVGHPAPFPVELPEQLIRLYTFADDLVLDPFMGSGSALVAAARTGRRFVGYDLDSAYVELARDRVAEAQQKMSGADCERTDADAAPTDPDVVGGDAFEAAAIREGRSAVKLALDVVETAGFTVVDTNRRVPKTAVTVPIIAHDASGGVWYFDVAGAFTSHHGGMVRNDVVWKALGRAAALRGRVGDARFVLLTTELPRRTSEGDAALRAAGPQLCFDVVGMFVDADRARLGRYAGGGFDARVAPEPGFWTPRDITERFT